MYLVNSFWTIADGHTAAAQAALKALAADVEAHEPNTWMYLVHEPSPDPGINIFPPPTSNQVGFIEGYKDRTAFVAHTQGEPYRDLLAKHGHLFVQALGARTTNQPFMTTSGLKRFAGFLRPQALSI